jgi:hypothetical protein
LLIYESTEQLLAEPEPRRYLHTVILTALRDKAAQVEVRFGEGEGMLYYRVDGRDWELIPPPEKIYPQLKDTVREAARLVRPERPETTVMFGVPDARFEPMEAGWLTYQLGSYWVDIAVPSPTALSVSTSTRPRSSPTPRAKRWRTMPNRSDR